MEPLNRRLLKPRACGGLIRLGLPRDGGYVVPDAAVKRSAVLLSLGMKQDWSFERHFTSINTRARVIGVDPSVGPWLFARQIVTSAGGALHGAIRGDGRTLRKHAAVLGNSLDYFWFFGVRHRHVVKLVSAVRATEHVTLDTLLLMAAQPAADHDVFLKMDIEGAEYGVIPDVVRHHRRFGCVVVEFHRLGKRSAMFNAAILQLLDHFRIVHVHGNNYSAYDGRNDFPDAIEVTLLNRALADEPDRESTADYPRAGLDFPNTPRRADHPLRFE